MGPNGASRVVVGDDRARHIGEWFIVGGVNQIARVFAPLIGLQCWGVQCGYGSFVTLEFGDPHVKSYNEHAMPLTVGGQRVKAPRRTTIVHGDWYLWIKCCFWQLFWENQEVIFCETDRESMRPALGHMSGAVLQSVSLDREALSTKFTFDLGWVLETHPYESAISANRLGADVAERWRVKGTSHQWLLHEPSGMVLSIDNHGVVTHERGDTPRGSFK